MPMDHHFENHIVLFSRTQELNLNAQRNFSNQLPQVFQAICKIHWLGMIDRAIIQDRDSFCFEWFLLVLLLSTCFYSV